MVERTLKLYECDKCGKEGQRYQIVYEDGTRILDRCPQHAKTLEAFRDEPGEWLTSRSGRTSFHKSTVTELRAAVARGKAVENGAGGAVEGTN